MYNDLLREVEHYLTSISGLYASDQEDFSHPFQLDCKELLDKISQGIYDDMDYVEKLLLEYQGVTHYIIEYGSNQRFRVNKDTRIMFKEYYVLFLDETSLPFKIINIGSIDSVHKC